MSMTVNCQHAVSIGQPDAVRCRAKVFERDGQTILHVVRVSACAGCDLRKPLERVPLTVSAKPSVALLRPPVPPADTATVQARQEVCGACEHNQGITEKMGTVRVRCAKCATCEGGRSLTAAGQACPIGKW